MSEYPADADEPTGGVAWVAAAVRPDTWVQAPGVMPLSAAASAPLLLSYTATLQDMVAAVLDHPVRRKQCEGQVRKAGWRRSLATLPFTLGLVLFANIFMFDLGVGWSVVTTVLLGGVFAVVQWSQIDHSIKRMLPAVVEKQALLDLAQRGDQRRLVAEPAGLTLADAAATGRFGWHQVQLTHTDRYVIVTAHLTSWAIPKTVGQPLACLVQFALLHGAS